MTLYDATIGMVLNGINGTIDMGKDVINGVPNGILKPTPRTTDVGKTASDATKGIVKAVEKPFQGIASATSFLTNNFSAILAIAILSIVAYIVSKIGGGK
jgi:hypothetical protein